MKFLKILFFLCFSIPVQAQDTLDWFFFHPIKKEWISAGQFGSVQESLIKIGELPDPFVGLNESKFDWIEDYEWEFKSTFYSDSITMSKHKIEMYFPWIDTYAKVFLNDSLILETSNAFLPYFVQIKDYMKLGENNLKVIFTPPILKHLTTASENGITYPAPNDIGKVQIAPLVRKPQYQFGWDWTMRMNTIGFIKPVSIRTYDLAKIKTTQIELDDIIDDTAIMNLNMYLTESISGDYLIESNYLGPLNNIEIHNGKLFLSFYIANPKLWWPRGQGTSHLYSDTIFLKTKYGKVVDSTIIQFGIRKSELMQEKDSVGVSYYFKINNRPIFCKGANVIPMDIFPSRITREKIESIVSQMVKSNFNIVRVWGGGYYLDEYFYELCDKNGIMVWQDCMFACAMYPSDDLFIESVKQELVYQIPRLANHPSVIQINGNNEVDVAWKFWGFQDKYKISDENQKKIAEDYNRLFKNLIPNIIKSITSIPYIHTSPLGHWINQEDFPKGTQHYWGVWHGQDPIEDFAKKSGRFNAEYGFQSFPEYSTLKMFSNSQDWSLNSPVMKSHQKSYVGNGMIKKHADILYGKTQSFEDFVYYSQLTQAKAVGIAISAHRLLSPYCMGTIYWQLNDCWPAPTWSSIDFYGNWKALQYRVKEDFRDIAVIEKTHKIGNETYFLVSDLPDTFNTEVKYDVYNLTGKKILSENKKIEVCNGTKYQLFKTNLTTAFLKNNYIVKFEWKDKSGTVYQRDFTHIGNKSLYKKALSTSFTVEIIKNDTIHKVALLRIKNTSFLNDFFISCSKKGVFFETNFISILPGVKEIAFSYDVIPTIADFKFKWR